MLQRLLWRDLWRLRGQLVPVALVAACGIATLVATWGTYQSLERARDAYYATHHFGEVFAHLVRAPAQAALAVGRIPGVAQVQTRVVEEVTVRVPGLPEPASARLVSVAADTTHMLNAIAVVRGRALDPTRSDQVLVSDAFAQANGLAVGDQLAVILAGRWTPVSIVGIALSPEFVYVVGRGMLFPDNQRFGVLWMPARAVAAAFGMQGAFNDVSLTLAGGIDVSHVTAALDALLRPYGGLTVLPREEQVSHRFLTDELGELRIMTTIIPSLFLAVSSFMLYMVLVRLVATQRPHIGMLKAFGYSDRRIGLHYLQLAIGAVLVGVLLGLPLGTVLGRLFVIEYREFFRFPTLAFAVTPSLVALMAAVTLLTGVGGAITAVRHAVGLAPAEAMRPTLPTVSALSMRLAGPWVDRVPIVWRLIARNLLRHPWKAALSAGGMALAIGLMLLGRFATDAPTFMLGVQFNDVQRDDVTVVYDAARGRAADTTLRHIPGILRAEPFSLRPVWLQHGHRRKRVELVALSAADGLRRIVDLHQHPVPLPARGLLLTDTLARWLDVRIGDAVTVSLLDGARPVVTMPVAGEVSELLGLNAYVDRAALARALNEDLSSAAAALQIDTRQTAAVYDVLTHLPGVASVESRSAIAQSLQQTMTRAFFYFSAVLVVFAGIIIAGTTYNSARLALSERGHEFASLCVLGYAQREVAALLLGEQAVLVLLALPTGLLLGYGVCAALIPLFARELFRVPLVINRVSYLYPLAAAVVAAALSGALMARQLAAIDLVATLKNRE